MDDRYNRDNSYYKDAARRRLSWRIFWGILFVLGAAALIAGQLNILPVFSGVTWADIIWTILLFFLVVWGIIRQYWVLVFFPLGGIVYLYKAQIENALGVNPATNLTWWSIFGAALLLTIGFYILFHGQWKRRKAIKTEEWFSKDNGGVYSYSYETGERKNVTAEDVSYGAAGASSDASENPDAAAAGACASEENTDSDANANTENSNAGDGTSSSGVYIRASFGETIKYVNSHCFTHAKIDCSFGSVKAYFDNVVPDAKGAIIDVSCSFGSVQLYIPRDWKLIDDTNRAFAGLEIKNPGRETATGPEVVVVGDIKFGGVEVFFI